MDYLGNVLNLYVELLISGRGRRAALLEMVGDELEKLWGDSGDSYLSELFDKYYTDDGVSVAGVLIQILRICCQVYLIQSIKNVVYNRDDVCCNHCIVTYYTLALKCEESVTGLHMFFISQPPTYSTNNANTYIPGTAVFANQLFS